MSNLIKNRIKLGSSQSGQAAIFITLILIAVMGIITLGVNEVIGRNIHESTNYQQSLQAGYAAESGVNDAIYALQQPGATIPSSSTQTCQGSGSFINYLGGLTPAISNTIDSPSHVAYTCLTVNPTPSSLLKSVAWAQSTVVRIDPVSASSSITFQWGSNPLGLDTSRCSQSFAQFIPYAASNQGGGSNWTCPFPVLRVDLFNSGSQAASYYTSSQALETYTRSFYFFPEAVTSVSGSYGPVTFGSTTAGQPLVVPAKCATSGPCTVTLSGINPAWTDGYARLNSIYSDAGNVTITASGGGGGFSNSQVEISSTGIDQSELRRVDVRVPIGNTALNTTYIPNYAVDAGWDFCKRFTLAGPSHKLDYDLTYNGGGTSYILCGMGLKPAIYLYPTHTEPINVKVAWPTGLKTTIPAYNQASGWNVIAHPGGSLTNVTNGQIYPYLYWEGNTTNFNFDMSQGFVVPGKDSASFLKHELAIIGLNNNEIAGFLQYWVPKMQNNPYSLIHFAGSDYTNMAPLNITPKPNSVLRVFMAEESINQPVKVTPQQFTPFHRSGFTVVEWGGSVLNSPSGSN